MSDPSLPRISTRATAAALDVLDAWRVPLEPLVEGLPYDLAHLRSTGGRLDWDTFAIFLTRVREAVGWDQLPELGRGLTSAPSWDFPRRFAALVVSPRQFVLGACRFFSPAVFPSIRSSVRELADGRIDVHLRVPLGGRPCAEFFHICHGHIPHITTLLGLPESEVTAHIEEESARFLVTVPESATLLSRMRRNVRSLLCSPSAMRELAARQEELLRTSEGAERASGELYQVLASLPVGVCLHRDGEVVYGNRELARALGYAETHDMIGASISRHAHPEDRERVTACIARVDTAVPVEPEGLRFIRTDGSTVVIEVTPVPPVHFGGELTRVVVARDVTRERQMQQQLVLADRLASLGTLAAGVAHEINNPLTWLRGSLDILERELRRMREKGVGTEHLGVMGDAVRAAMDGAKRVSTIVGDLRTLSRPIDEQLEPVEVVEVLDSAVRVAAKQLGARARIVREYEEVPRVTACPGRLGQVFLNLLLNAAEALPNGEPDRQTVTLRVRPAVDGRVEIEVSDTGPGIPPHVMSRIFDPFFTTKPGVGTGLGLSISHAIVSRLGGEIAAVTNEGRGTTMRIVLPASDAARPVLRESARRQSI